jgi:uncharacterized protein (TIGR03086 family)
MAAMPIPVDPAQRHRVIAQEFADIIAQVKDWSAPTPVKEWTAADVPAHLIEWLPGVLEGATGIKLPEPSVDPHAEPATAWREHAAGVQAVLDDEKVAIRKVEGGPFSGMQVGEMIDRLYTADVFMHRYDLARSNDLDPQQDPQFCEDLLVGMSSIEELLRDSGQFGLRVPTPDDAPVADRLAAFIGRDPQWQPSRRP